MSDKSIKEVVFKDGELHPPLIRGTIEAWIESKEDFNYKEEHGTIPVEIDHGIRFAAKSDWFQFLNSRVEENLVDGWDEDGKKKFVRDIFVEYWEDNEDIRERFKDISYWTNDGSILVNVSAAEEQGGIDKLIEEHGQQNVAEAAYKGSQYIEGDDYDGESEGDDEGDGQSSFGESQYPQLHDIGVVDDTGTIKESKLRGLVVAFTKDVDEIHGESREFEVNYVQSSFLYWGKDKFGPEWIKFLANNTEFGPVYDAIEWVMQNDGDSRMRCKKKYVGNVELEVGNIDTNDVTKVFLDTEAPGWDEVEDDDEDDGDMSKWERFEKKSDEKENTKQKETKTEDNPDSLQDWADKEGSTDEVHKPSRTRALGEFEGSKSSNGQGSKHDKNGETTSDSIDVECEDFGRPYPIEWPNVSREDDLECNRIYEGNTFEWSMRLPKNSIDTIVTSPPYYALRDYDIDDAFPISGDFTCDHDWDNNFCMKCGSFLGQLGHEPDPAMFIEHIVDLMARYKRVLKPTGSLWLNIGDTYAGESIDGRVKANELSRMMIPERVYRRMVQTGWRLRDYVIWVKKVWMPDDDLKGNGKPFSGSSRLADQWEPMVRFTQSADHYSDVDSNRLMPPSFDGDLGEEGIEGKFREGEDTQRGKTYNALGTNPPDVWLINSDGYDGDHRAVFPEQLPQRCINISTPDRVCEKCGKPYEKEAVVEDENTLSPGGDYAEYEKQCRCSADHEPGVAFDPFLGSGTTAVAAANNGFDWAGVELSEKYVELARQRIPKGRQVGITDW